ncbi:mCG144500, partial [Mus musculus]
SLSSTAQAGAFSATFYIKFTSSLSFEEIQHRVGFPVTKGDLFFYILNTEDEIPL